MLALRVLLGVVGAVTVIAVVASAARTVVLPRGEPVRLTGAVFRSTRAVFDLLLRTQRTFAGKDRLMAHYAPFTLLLLPLVWLAVAWLGFSCLFWAVEGGDAWSAMISSGSALTTLGFDRPRTVGGVLLSFTEAGLSISVLALLLVTYLPSMYAAFSDREQQVALLEVRAGTPPTAVELLTRARRIRGLAVTDRLWEDWEQTFARLAESHTSLPALVFFRSPNSQQSWVCASGAVLDAAAFLAAVVDLAAIAEEAEGIVEGPEGPRLPQAEVCIRAGFLALRKICDQFGIAHPADPRPDDPISISREEFDVAIAQLREADVPLRADIDQAWRDWAGWRVNYDAALVQLAAFTLAPPTPWVSDRDVEALLARLA